MHLICISPNHNPATGKRHDITVKRGPLYAQGTILPNSRNGRRCNSGTKSRVSRELAGVQGCAAAAAVQKKCPKYKNLADAVGLHFIPIIFESAGLVDDYACAFFGTVAEVASRAQLIPKEAIYRYWMTHESVTLQKRPSSALLRKVIASVNKSDGLYTGRENSYLLDQNEVHVYSTCAKDSMPVMFCDHAYSRNVAYLQNLRKKMTKTLKMR